MEDNMVDLNRVNLDIRIVGNILWIDSEVCCVLRAQDGDYTVSINGRLILDKGTVMS